MATSGGSIFSTKVWRKAGLPVCAVVSRASRPASGPAMSLPGLSLTGRPAASAFVSVLAMAADLPTQLFGDLDGQLRHGRVLDTTRLRDVDPPLMGHPA